MLKQRVITGFFLIAVVLCGAVLLPNAWFTAIALVITLYGGWEWSRITLGKPYAKRIVYVLLLLGLAAVLWYGWLPQISSETMFTMAAIVWCLLLGLLTIYPEFAGGKSWLKTALPIIGLVVLMGFWLAVSYLHAQDWQWVIFLFALIAIADTAAYFVGRRFGTTKLAPSLSPGKTRAGLWGALGFSVITALAGAWWFALDMKAWPYFIGLSVLVVLFSIAGDLFESLLKREAGVKDSGYLLPGHGGVLDRIDSLIAGAPIFALGLLWM